MAIGGALRAAIKAGNWASAARESRRRARALAQIRGSRPSFRGVTPENFVQPQSAYEGFRVWPTVADPSIGMRRPLSPTLPPWQGAGVPPRSVASPVGFSPLGFNSTMNAPLPREAWVGPSPFGSQGATDYITDAMGNRWLDDGYMF